jgi:hypothetical protein
MRSISADRQARTAAGLGGRRISITRTLAHEAPRLWLQKKTLAKHRLGRDFPVAAEFLCH